ncbi:MAG: hypothetical protein AAF633_25655 [Chloroflexota bacterium]
MDLPPAEVVEEIVDGREPKPTPTVGVVPTRVAEIKPKPLQDLGSTLCAFDFTVYDARFQNQPIVFDDGSLSFRVADEMLKIDAAFSEDDRYIDFGLPCGSTADFDLSFEFGLESTAADSPLRTHIAFRHQNRPGTDMRHYFALFSTEGYYGIYYVDGLRSEIKTLVQQDTTRLSLSAGQTVVLDLEAIGDQLRLSIDGTEMVRVTLAELQAAGEFKMGLDGKADQTAIINFDELVIKN